MVRQNFISSILLILASILFSCASSKTKDRTKVTPELVLMTNEVNTMLDTFPVVNALFFGEQALGPRAGSIKNEVPIEKNIIEHLLRKKPLPDSGKLTFYSGYKLVLDGKINLYVLYMVENAPYDNVTVYLFSVLKDNATVIDTIKLAYYEEHQENSIVEEGGINSSSKELNVGTTFFSIDAFGKFIKNS